MHIRRFIPIVLNIVIILIIMLSICSCATQSMEDSISSEPNKVAAADKRSLGFPETPVKVGESFYEPSLDFTVETGGNASADIDFDGNPDKITYSAVGEKDGYISVYFSGTDQTWTQTLKAGDVACNTQRTLHGKLRVAVLKYGAPDKYAYFFIIDAPGSGGSADAISYYAYCLTDGEMVRQLAPADYPAFYGTAAADGLMITVCGDDTGYKESFTVTKSDAINAGGTLLYDYYIYFGCCENNSGTGSAPVLGMYIFSGSRDKMVGVFYTQYAINGKGELAPVRQWFVPEPFLHAVLTETPQSAADSTTP